MVNVMGDALATGIMAHICRKDFVKEGEQVINPHTHNQDFCPLAGILGVTFQGFFNALSRLSHVKNKCLPSSPTRFLLSAKPSQ